MNSKYQEHINFNFLLNNWIKTFYDYGKINLQN